MSNTKLFAGTIAGLFVIYAVLDMLIRITNEIGDVVSRGVLRMSKHAATDEKIIELIRFGATTFGQLVIHMKDVEWRLIDRRLQALKKKGAIKFVGPGWGWRVIQ